MFGQVCFAFFFFFFFFFFSLSLSAVKSRCPKRFLGANKEKLFRPIVKAVWVDADLGCGA